MASWWRWTGRSIAPTAEIVRRVREAVPGARIIGFPKGGGLRLDRYVRETGIDAIGIDWTVRLVFITIIGGIGTIEGPIVGSIIYVVLQQWLSEYPSVSLLILGMIAIAVILVAPKGIMGTIQEKLGFEILSPRRR